jgi:hypothetical protein
MLWHLCFTASFFALSSMSWSTAGVLPDSYGSRLLSLWLINTGVRWTVKAASLTLARFKAAPMTTRAATPISSACEIMLRNARVP